MPNIQYTTKIERVYTHEDSLSVSYRRPDDIGPTFIKVYYDKDLIETGSVVTSEYIQSLIATKVPLEYWARIDRVIPEDILALETLDSVDNDSANIEVEKTKLEGFKDEAYKLVPDFSFVVDGNVVSFTELCSGLCDDHQWNFGFNPDEGVTLPWDEASPIVEFPGAGEYEVSHTAVNKHKRETVTKTVTIV